VRLALALVLLPLTASAAIVDYPIKKKTLDNGLDVLVVETPEFKDVLSYNTMVLAGSGREQERGKTGLAHLFEHILFRDRFRGVDGGYDDWMSRLGTDNNAWTWFDITYYHPLTFTSNLTAKDGRPGLVDLEVDRFSKLDISEKTYRTEAGAVLGEYRKNASHPSEKLDERLSALMFGEHPYGHTTMGYYEDVVNMPNSYPAAQKFYDTYYRPNDVVLIVAGDVKAEQIFPVVEEKYKSWKKLPTPAVSTAEKPLTAEQDEHLAWDSDVAPIVWVAYKMPAFDPGSTASGAAELLNELLVSPAAPLYKKIRYEKQTASSLGFEEGTQGFESFAPRALVVSAELYKEKLQSGGAAYFKEVSSDIEAGLDALKSYSSKPGADKELAAVKSKYRYDFLAQLTSPRNIASTLGWYYRFNRNPDVLNQLLETVDKVTPADIDKLAQAQFVPTNRVVLTLSHEEKAKK
jgi:zinc protease